MPCCNRSFIETKKEGGKKNDLDFIHTLMFANWMQIEMGKIFTIVSCLSTQLEPRSFVRILSVGAYFRRSIPKSPVFRRCVL
jgi:hypothetical protein